MTEPEPALAQAQASRPYRSLWPYLGREWLRQVGEALLVAFGVTTFLFTTVGVLGTSDLPNVRPWERVFIPKYETWLYRLGYGGYRRGDLVVVKPPADAPSARQPLPLLGRWGFTYRPYFIKRVVGLPGDRIRMEQGQLYLNGHKLEEAHTVPYWRAQGQWDQTSDLANSAYWPFRHDPGVPEYVVPAGHYFVVGDNRSWGGSEDSRTFGPVPLEQMGGRAATVIWPPAYRDEEGHWQWGWRRLGQAEAFKDLR